MKLTRQQALCAARSKAAIAGFLGDANMWSEALWLYIYAIGYRTKI
ncbi:host cell division inhibitory peptide Kil [Pantoea agglomerans]|uniref:Host cell division inhibitory peptide Kil n=1 Tax=Enterobacter agglomerans TaxID=549 RepID=A0ACC5PWC1_ENTAG|nr:host cell division inhibitory peptide Kil [Pantoea agglomerans]MBD8153781.1 host cell division inhibitory peptide Kil [Pantoea agglomerans]MBD8157772.1 host cell division inhibitory peptide Kil [Pantoea agglomerans]MBD8231610.1 host cell division inhibitory peptide Kil [Pantoea agglomerans]MBD8241696.1 host cell division inhibitory peptide Kil [Pantoea agglomerans]